MRYSAAFLDRDGTLIRDPGYVDDPADVELVPGAAEAVSLLNARRIPVVVVTNQSGIGRGYYTEEDFRRVQEEVERQLAMRGAAVDDVLHCPHHPEREPRCDCRKPGLGMYREAAERHSIDLAGALFVGDKVSDVVPGLESGGTAYLLGTGQATSEDEVPEGCSVADDVRAAVRSALGLDEERTGERTDA